MTSTNNDNKEKKMFFTTSDLVSKMNASMKEANILPTSSASSDDDAGGGFELQRKMPDGSYRRADEKEVAAADFQSKMKQASEAIKTLNPQQKIEWAKYQRTEGNVLFAKGEYKEAMDVYLTCLVAMDQTSSSSTSSPPSDDAASVASADDNDEKTNDGRRNDDDVTNGDDDEEEEQQLNIQIEKDIKLPVLLNLALSALKLGMLSKAEQFCNHAIETELGKQSAKAHFRRGRVRMLMGHFVSAELDLDKAHELIDTNMIMRNSDNNIVTDINDREENNQKLKELENEKTVILREKQKLNRLVNHAHKNEKQQKRAMQKLFNSDEQQQRRQQAKKSQAIQDLYPEKATPASTKQSNEQSEIVNEYSQPTTYVQWYMQMIGRCAQKILDVIGHGDDEDDEPVEVPVDQDLLETLMNDKKNA